MDWPRRSALGFIPHAVWSVAAAFLLLMAVAPLGLAASDTNPARAAAGDGGAPPPGPTVRVGLITGVASATAGSAGRSLVVDPWGRALVTLEGEVDFAVVPGDFIVVAGVGPHEGPLTVRPDVGASPEAAYVTVSGCPYRGEIILTARNGLLTVVNQLPLEDYLLGVVPREMPADFPAEALKAQAVAARTYAVYTMRAGAYAPKGYDLEPTTACQVYGGMKAERASTTEAVRATAGEVITYGGVPIAAFYHSCSGGHTESVDYVWGSSSPYLKGVPDYDQDSPHYRWTVVMEARQVEERLQAAGLEVGRVKTLAGVGPRGPGGRYLDCEVAGSESAGRVRSERLRFALGLRSTHFDVVAADERMTTLVGRLEEGDAVAVGAGGTVTAPVVGLAVQGARQTLRLSGDTSPWVVSKELVPATFTFTGGGWGHAVGMSQWGARGMALDGKTYRDILTHYYTGVSVGTLP